MSGGVDSSAAAYLAKQRGFECMGAKMKLFADDGAEDAGSVAHRLEMPFQVFDFSLDFKKKVIDRFVEAYQGGATPNPCIECNRHLKFGKLLARARQLDLDYIVTGHYARVEYDAAKNRYLLKKAVDRAKDQSYFLYSLTQEQLCRTIFPLGGLLKSEVREIAFRQGFATASKRDSQDICFVAGDDYAKFIEEYTGQKCDEGDFIDIDGNVLGRHKGQIGYTIGQRKGLGIAWANPLYVKSKNTRDNTITLCENGGLFEKSLQAADFNWIACESPHRPVRVKAKIRYAQAEQWATAVPISDNAVHIEFDEPQRAITKGQAVALYDGDVVLGGGTIK